MYEFSDGFAIRGGDVLLIVHGYLVGLSSCKITLEEMEVHLVSIEVSVVGFAVGVMETDSLFVGKYTSHMSHD